MSLLPDPGRMVMKPLIGIFLLYSLLGGLVACSESHEPIDRMNAILRRLVAIAGEPGEDIRAKKEKIEAYWNSQQSEIASIKQALADKIVRTVERDEKEKFVHEFDTLVEKLLELKKILLEQGIEL